MRSKALRPGAALVASIASLLLLATGCKGNDNGTTPLTPSIDVTLSTASFTVMQGTSGEIDVNVSRNNGYSGIVNLTVDTPPAGITWVFTPTPMPMGTNVGVLELEVKSSVAPGTYTLTIRGTGTGVADDVATLSLVVTAAGSFTLSASPSTVSVQQGASGSTTITIARTGGFTGAVALSAPGAPSGVTAAFAPSSVTGTTATLTLTAAANATPGTYTLTVRGNTGGLSEQTTNVSLQITASGGGTSVSLAFCAPDIPIWVGVQNESGPWTHLTPTSGNNYAFNVGARAGIAVVMNVEGEFETTVVYMTASELASLAQASAASCAHVSGTKTLSGSVTGISATQSATVAMGDASSNVTGPGPMSFQLTSAPDAAADLVAVRQVFDFTGLVLISPDKFIIRRNVSLPSGSTIPLLDFAAAEAFSPATATITLNNTGGDTALVATAFSTAGLTQVPLTLAEATSTVAVAGIPASALASGDLHQLSAISSPAGSTNALRGVDAYFHAVGSSAVSFGPTLNQPAVSTLSSSSPQRLRAQLASQGAYGGTLIADFLQEGATAASSREVTLFATVTYFGGLPSNWDLSIPDLSLAAYDPLWGLQAGVLVDWSVTASSSVTFTLVNLLPPDGTVNTYAMRTSGVGALRSANRVRAISWPALRAPGARLVSSMRQAVPHR